MAKEAQEMSFMQSNRLVREGHLMAEVNVDLIEMEGGWSPYLSLDYANRLDDIRDALRAGDLMRASKLSHRIYRLTPITAS
jgi:hypothetical protein